MIVTIIDYVFGHFGHGLADRINLLNSQGIQTFPDNNVGDIVGSGRHKGSNVLR